MKPRPRYSYIGIALAALVGGWLILHAIHSQEVLKDPAAARAYLAQEIVRQGPAKAYASFVAKNHTLPREDQHFSAHLMGEVLYAAGGVESIAICDSQFGFGCYHGLFGRAIAEGGVERIKELDDACVEAFGAFGTGCQHGIGHGILEYTGHDDISRALQLCGDTTQLVPLLGCTSGVFMEYNTPLAGDPESLAPQIRSFDALRPYEPCDEIDSAFQASCYYELGQWFIDTVSDETHDISSFCGALQGEARHHCYLGIGSSVAITVEYEPGQTVALCERFAAEDALMCRAGAAWMFYANPEHRMHSKSICAYEDGERSARCTTRADFTEGLAK